MTVVAEEGLLLSEGRTFGPYVIDKELGTGGMATAWRARRMDYEPTKPVVLKTMLPHISQQPRFVAMFIREAVLGAELSHKNLVQVFDVGLLDDRYYIEMEYVDGTTLREVLRRAGRSGEPLPLALAIATIADCCDALAYIHDFRDPAGRPLKLVHRDVSPENLMTRWDGVTKLLDFGIATAEPSMVTVSGERKGKMHYMPPESFRSAPANKNRDIYAVGATLYELVAGRRPFVGKNEAELMFNIAEGQLIRPRRLRPDVPTALDELIVDALSRDPDRRPPDAASLSRQLRTVLSGVDPRPRDEIVADAMRTLFAQTPSNEDPRAEDSLATLDPEEVVVVDASERNVDALPVRSSTADWFTQSSVQRSSVGEDLISDVFTKSSLPRNHDDRTSSVFMLYGRSSRRSEDVVKPEPLLAAVRPSTDPRGTDPKDGHVDEQKQNALLHFERGMEHKRSGRLNAALAEWELAAELDPANRTIATNVRILKRKMG